MQNPYKKITASLLLFSHMLTSCYNPNIGIGKQALPTPEPADKQRQYAGEPHEYPPKPTSHTLTTADKHPIAFTYLNGQWQAEVEEHAAHGSSQHRELPVVLEPGLALEDVVDSNPIEQKLLLHLYASEEEPDQPSYVYVGRAPSQAKPHHQLLSSTAARQTATPSQVGLAQQQATTQQQPKGLSSSVIQSNKGSRQAAPNIQQAQEQPGPQAVLSLSSPVQQIREGPRSQDQLRVTSKPLPVPSRETPSQRLAKKQPTSPQQAPSRRALSWRNQHELVHSQRAAQAKRAQSAATAKPGNELAQPAQSRQAIVATPRQPPSLADKAPQGITSQVLLAQGGHPVRFMPQDGQWWARVNEHLPIAFPQRVDLPVYCQQGLSVEEVGKHDTTWHKHRQGAISTVLDLAVPGSDFIKTAIGTRPMPQTPEELANLVVEASFDFIPFGQALKIFSGPAKKLWIQKLKKFVSKLINKKRGKAAKDGARGGIKMTAKVSDNIIGGTFKYTDGKITEFLANRKAIGNRIEFTDIVFYPKGAAGNELKNAFGSGAMIKTLEAMKDYARSQGFKQVRIHFQRAAGSSSAKPGKVFDKIFDL